MQHGGHLRSACIQEQRRSPSLGRHLRPKREGVTAIRSGRFPNSEGMEAREAPSWFVGGFVAITKMASKPRLPRILWSQGVRKEQEVPLSSGSFCMGLFVRHQLRTLGLPSDLL